MRRSLVVAVVPDQDLTSGNLYVTIDGQERRVEELHPAEKAYAWLDPKLVLRQHPDAYYRLRVKPDDVWQPPGGPAKAPGSGPSGSYVLAPSVNARQSLEGFLGPRLPGLFPPTTEVPTTLPSGQRLTAWGWMGVLGSAANAVGLLFFPLSDSSTLAQLHALGGHPTALARLVSERWFSPLLGVLTAACLVQAFRSPNRRRLWISASYLPALIGFAVAIFGFYSAYTSVLDSIK
jgi:hypothetical protein